MSCQVSGSGGAGRGPDGGVKFFFTADTTVTAPCRHTLTGSTCTMLHKGASRPQYLLRWLAVHQGSLVLVLVVPPQAHAAATTPNARTIHYTQGTQSLALLAPRPKPPKQGEEVHRATAGGPLPPKQP